jgi:hypothetical protein
MSKISLFKAFSILRNGPDFLIGEGYRWKSRVFNLALGSLLIFPILNFWCAQWYGGDLPPAVPLVQGVGPLSDAVLNPYRRPREYMVNFLAPDGKIYQMNRLAIDSNKEVIRKLNTGENFYVEGFVLQNGNGNFWPTLVAATDGRILLSREAQMEVLIEERSVFGWGLMLEYSLTIPLWVISLVNAVKIKNRLSKEG